MEKTNKIINFSSGLFLPVVVLAVWYALSHSGFSDPSVIPPPEKVAGTIKQSLGDGFLLKNIKISFGRVIKGFAVGSLSGFVFGTVMGLSSTGEKIIAPLFHAIRNVPLVGWVPLFIIWFGFGEKAQVIFISLGAFYPVVLNTFYGIRGVKREYVEVGWSFDFKKPRLFWRIILPASLPSIFTGIRLSLGISWMLVVAAEIFGVSTGGVGNMMSDGREFFKMDIVIMGIFTIGIIGFIMNKGLTAIERSFLSWKRNVE